MQGSQSLVHLCAACWKRPRLLGWELLWRWGFGLPAAAVLWYQGLRMASRAALSLDGLSLSDPMQSAQQLMEMAATLKPLLLHAGLWLAPLLALLWALVSGLGRTAVLTHLDPTLHRAPVTLVVLQLLRIFALAAVCLGWFYAIRWAAQSTLNNAAPNLVAYSSWVICLTLGIFILWALLSWIFLVAPLLAMIEGKGPFQSVVRSLRLGKLTAKLVEVNLVLGIVRLGLVVLAMVFSAIPLPFASDMSGLSLYLWWAFVTLLYLIASDFFQVSRLAAFLQLWRNESLHADQQ